MTPREFHALVSRLTERRREEFERGEYFSAMICAQVFNAQRSKESQHVFQPREFMSTYRPPPQADEQFGSSIIDSLDALAERMKARDAQENSVNSSG